MPETTPAESSPAETADVFNGGSPTVEEFNHYRETGEVPTRFKPAENAESAPADTPEETENAEGETPESAPESEPEDEKEIDLRTASGRRIKKLLAERHELRQQLDQVRKQGAPPASPAVSTERQPSQPQTYTEWEKAFDPSKWIEEYAKAHPDATYEAANAKMFSHMLDIREKYREFEQRTNAERSEIERGAREAKERYGDEFDTAGKTFTSAVLSPDGKPLIPMEVLSLVNSSEVLPDLVFVIGNDAKTTAEFVEMARTNPHKAVRYIAAIEAGIAEELAGAGSTPEPKKTEKPKPVSPVGGSSSRSFDVSDDSLSPEEWFRLRNQQVARKT